MARKLDDVAARVESFQRLLRDVDIGGDAV
jgi:hypothetical protein